MIAYSILLSSLFFCRQVPLLEKRTYNCLLYIRGGGLGRATVVSHVLEIEFLYAAPHSHAQESAMRHVQDVAKIEPCTSKQAQNNNPTAKQHLQLKPSCAVLETPTSRKRQNRNNS
jgi:hypothetical protein